jgi:hypothetical protein
MVNKQTKAPDDLWRVQHVAAEIDMAVRIEITRNSNRPTVIPVLTPFRRVFYDSQCLHCF